MRWAASLTWVCVVMVFAAASCGDDVAGVAGGAGGAGGDGGVGGVGGVGGTPAACGNCPDDAPICFKDECLAACPSDLERCAVDATPGADDICCPVFNQCCGARDNGYPADLCSPIGVPCPTLCADGTTTCSGWCVFDPYAGAYGCADQCSSERVCGAECCPLGSRCADGQCALADITIDAARVVSSAKLDYEQFDASSCAIVEGCIAAPGARTLLRFDLRTPNIGVGDLFMGDPLQQTDLFEYSSCHDHFHFTTYAAYRLLDAQMNVVANGHKQAFCLIDIEAFDPGANPAAVYSCEFQGIQAGWADVYDRSLPCQWVDVTGVAPGDYLLEVSLNTDQVLAESDYSNNTATVSVTIPADSCPNGCAPFDAACCQIGNPCNLEANGICDCAGLEPWDVAECQSCYACDVATSCPGGCTPDAGACCAAGDPCNKANDGVCDCAGTTAWDGDDCAQCLSGDPNCPATNSCPNGCTANNPNEPCCGPNNICGWDNDGWCDCGGATAWDTFDCFSCQCP